MNATIFFLIIKINQSTTLYKFCSQEIKVRKETIKPNEV